MSTEQVAVKALQTDKLRWLTNITMEDLVRFRERGQMEEVRKLFRDSQRSLRTLSDGAFATAADVVADELVRRLDDEEKRLVADSKQFSRSVSLDVLSFTAGLSFGVASALLPALAPLALPSALISATVGTKSLADLAKAGWKRYTDNRDYRNRPIAVMLEAFHRPI